MSADILIYAIVAAGLIFWLRSLLGTKTGNERERPNPFTSHPESLKKQTAPDVSAASASAQGQEGDLHAGLDRNMSIENATAERGIFDIAQADRNFDLSHFLHGAQEAFIMIIESFAAGDKEALEDLLSEPVYEAFEQVIDERARKGESASVEIHSIRKTEVVNAWIADKRTFITVRFTADETSIIRNSAGEVTFGDPDRVTETIDVWTFGRLLRSRDPAWLLFETREDAKDEISGSTVPETDKDGLSP